MNILPGKWGIDDFLNLHNTSTSIDTITARVRGCITEHNNFQDISFDKRKVIIKTINTIRLKVWHMEKSINSVNRITIDSMDDNDVEVLQTLYQLMANYPTINDRPKFDLCMIRHISI